jgi:very-short-patch-repair endonuclease
MLHKQIARTPGRAATRLERLIAHGPTPTRSGDEDEIVELLRRHSLPRHVTNTRIPGLPSWIEVDIHFPDHNLVIEVDSPCHDTPIRQEDDAHKEAILNAHGLRVLRLRKVDASPANEPGTIERIRKRLLQFG